MGNAPSATVPGALAGGRYQVRRLLGEGLLKRVYLAYDTRLDRDVALALICVYQPDTARPIEWEL